MSEVKAKGIKEINEFLEANKIIGINVAQALKDGLDLSDVKEVIDIVKEYQKIVEGFKGLGEAWLEVKDLDQAELAQVGAKAIEAYGAVKKEI